MENTSKFKSISFIFYECKDTISQVKQGKLMAEIKVGQCIKHQSALIFRKGKGTLNIDADNKTHLILFKKNSYGLTKKWVLPVSNDFGRGLYFFSSYVYPAYDVGSRAWG
jgi:hypothetical protein